MKEKYLFIPPKPRFTNKVIDKKELKKLMAWAFSNYGTGRASYMADKLKDLGFHYATQAGLSLSVEDLKVPPTKRKLLHKTNEEIKLTEQQYERGEITIIERFQKVIDTWNTASEELKDEVVKYFRETDPLNPIYIMAFSGARGNISQVRQLVGMRGLMANPQGQIIDLPIKSNFREGLTVTEYLISSYGARKGLVDTALRTADSGYLTRRLVDVAQDIIIREIDCGTHNGIVLKDMVDNNQTLIPLQNRLLGRVLFETLYSPDDANIIAHINQDLDYDTANFIIRSGIKSVIVRSPLTCESSRSVCQFCYGWNLAHGSLVDLGEAVGIIAAQSIGEPGTQLTMRTFHTGGVFTGEIAEQIKAPFNGVIRLPKSMRSRLIRTRHGEEALVLDESYKLDLYDYRQQKHKVEFSQGSILFVNDNEQFKENQVIGEIGARGKLITERATKDLTTEISGEVYFSNLNIEEKIDRQGNVTVTTSKGGLIWILSGEVYNLPTAANIKIKQGDEIKKGTILATNQVISDYGGYVRLDSKTDSQIKELKIITSSILIENAFIRTSEILVNSEFPYNLEFNGGEIFNIICSPGNKIVNSQIIAELIEENYKTSTGGLLKYESLEVNKKNKNKKGYEIIGEGKIYWIPEETHEINKDMSLLMVEHGEFVEKEDELIKDLQCNNSGYIEIIQEDKIVKEIIIKPGTLHNVSEIETFKTPKIYQPNEIVYGNYKSEVATYVELTDTENNQILIRPVIEYFINKKDIKIKNKYSSASDDSINVKLVNKILYRDGEHIKSAKGIDLVKTYLIMVTSPNKPHLAADIEFLPVNSSDLCQLQLTVLESLQIKHDTFGEVNKGLTTSNLCVVDGQMIEPGTVVAETHLLSESAGKIEKINTTNKATRKIIMLTEKDLETIPLNGQTPQVSEGELVKYGDQIADKVIAKESGQVMKFENDSITIRSGYPYLVSSGAILQTNNSDLVQRGDTLAILVFERSKTGDIVQGLPRIEEILEARKPKEPCRLSPKPGKIKIIYDSDETNCIKIFSSDGSVTEFLIGGMQKIIVSNGENILLSEALTDGAPNPHEMLSLHFNFYTNFISLYEAAKLSLQKVQIYLVNEVQNVYQSQNVDISDKHIEVIVRQMTSKVKVEDGGDTTLLPGELVELQQIENINEAMTLTKGIPATYSPVLLGITKSSLNTDSFISAASFQETTRVLTEAAIEGKADWLRGLKENVIIGRLIPAGTGFNSYSDISNSFTSDKKVEVSDEYYFGNDNNKRSTLEDMVLDDNSTTLIDKIQTNFVKIKDESTKLFE
jgi:DNA-directed RNA polymerase subunit beta'